MDIRKHALTQTGTIELHDGADNPLLDDNGKPVRVHVYSPGSREYLAAEKARDDKMIQVMRKKHGSVDSYASRVEFLVAVTKGFEGIEFDDLKGAALYRAVYSEPTLRFVADQVLTYVNDHANFTQPSGKS